jgi:hypothetical protein
MTENSVVDFIVYLFRHTGSPHIFNFFQLSFIFLPDVFFVTINALLYMFTAVAIYKISGSKSLEVKAFVSILVIFYPYYHMSSAGWIVTSVAYFWVLAFGMMGIVGLAKVIRNEKISNVEYVFYFLCNLIGVGNLQLAPLLLGLYIIIAVYLFLKKRYPLFVFIQLFVIIANLAYHLLAPGSRARYWAEVLYSFPAYPSFSLSDKLQLGFVNTVFHFVNERTLFFFLFSIILFIGVCAKHKNPNYRIVAFIPLLSNLIWGVFRHIFGGMFVNLSYVIEHAGMSNAINPLTYLRYVAYIPLAFSFIFVFCIAISVFLIFGKAYKTLLFQTVLVGGFASRMILSFSPTIFASAERTFIFMYFCMIVCAAMVYQEIHILCTRKHRLYLVYGSGIASIPIILERVYLMR